MKRFLFLSIAVMCSFPMAFAQHPMDKYHRIESLKQKVQKNDINAMNQLGLLYLEIRNEKKAVEMFERASLHGHQSATFNLAYCYLTSSGVEQDGQKALSLLKRVAETVKEASALIACCYLYGYVGKDYDQAVFWIKKGLAKGDTTANLHLAYAYSRGLGVEKDERKSLELYLPFAQKGVVFAQYEMALIYHDGEPSSRDCRKALTWFEKVAHRYNDALVIMGEIYEKGECIPKNITKAKEYYRLASDYGIPLGESHLGTILYDEKEYAEAFSLLLQAAEDKNYPVPEAMRRLSACYRYGLGVDRNQEKSEYWLNQAAKFKDYTAIKILNEKITMTDYIGK